jgi:hypothetical protein
VTPTVSIHEIAEAEINEAADFYDLESPGLGIMGRDPIVEEVRRNREAVARERGNDVGAIIAAFKREDAASRRSPHRTSDPSSRPERDDLVEASIPKSRCA